MTQETHTVNLTPPLGTAGWLISVDGGKSEPAGSYPAVVVAYKNTAQITFSIQNGANQNVTFADNPILLPAKANNFSDASGGGTAFTITDHNLKKEHVPYVLLFNGAPKIDPIIDNNGGGHLLMFSSVDYAAAAVALVAGLIIGLFVQKKFRLF